MGAKKKKTLANKLAKMSDEERARYLQHKADAEEEARRRKEQLIAIFMKNKIKREDAFSRLNLAKINQEWHQILRKAKCKEMKENVGHLKNWIERVLTLKNRTIDNLILELEEAELQYSYNFQTHISQIQEIIGKHQQYMNKMHQQYEVDCKRMFDEFSAEIKEIKLNANNNEMYLKTIMFGLDKKTNEDMSRRREKFINDYDDVISSQHLELEKLTKSREAISTAIWREIARILRDYVQRTDHRRLHLAELTRLDAESAAEIAEYQERIKRSEIEIQQLKKLNTRTREAHENQLIRKKQNLISLTKTFRSVRDQLQAELKVDERKLAFMTSSSYKVLQYLETVLQKGQQIQNLVEICKKYETEEEKVMRYQILHFKDIEDNDEKQSETKVEILQTPEVEKVSELSSAKSKTKSTCSLNQKTSITADDFKIEKPVDKIMLAPKRFSRSARALNAARIASQEKSNFLEKHYKPLLDLEGLWAVQSRATLNLLELKKEKRNLMRENQQLEELLRNVLEATVLRRSAPCSRISSGVVSRKIRGRSAPAKC